MDQLLHKASKCLENKRFTLVIEYCNKILQSLPKHPSALFMLAIAQGENDNINQSIITFKTLIKLHPENSEVYYNYGLMLQKHNKNNDAIDAYNKSIQFNHLNPFAYNNLGNLLYSNNSIIKSLKLYETAVKLQPNNGGFIRNYCKSLFASQNYEICIDKLNSLKQLSLFDIHDCILEINSYIELNNYRKALAISSKYLTSHTDNHMLYYLAGIAALKMSRFPNAIKLFLKSIKLNNNHITSHMNLAIAYSYDANYDSANDTIENIKLLSENNLEAIEFICQIKEMQNDFDINDPYIKTCLKKFPTNTPLMLLKAQYFISIAQYESSFILLNKIVKEEPDQKLCSQGYYKLGTAYDKNKQFDLAWNAYNLANSIVPQVNLSNHFNENILHSIQQVKSLKKSSINTDYMSEFKVIFVVGFPRSGTTLIDSILSCNESSIILEEVPLIDDIANTLLENVDFDNYFETLMNLSPTKLTELRKYYQDSINNYRHWTTDQTIIDKSPINLIHTLLIHKLFPQAPIVFALRHPVDACISCYMQDFRSNNELTQCFKSHQSIINTYDNMMNLWHEYIEVSNINYYYIYYEKLVSDFENQTKKLLEFVGFKWSDTYLKFHKKTKSRGMIHNPSYNQVNQPINQNRAYRYLNYGKNVELFNTQLINWIKRFKY